MIPHEYSANRCVSLALLASLGLFLSNGIAYPECPTRSLWFEVNDLGDAPDANYGDGLALTAAGTTTLRAAIDEAEVSDAHGYISFDDALFNSPVTIHVTSPLGSGGCFEVTGPGADLLTIDGGGKCGLFSISGEEVWLEGLTLRGGKADLGGAIYCRGGLVLYMCVIEDCEADNAGAIAANDASVRAWDCTFRRNLSLTGGFYAGGAIGVWNTTFRLHRCLIEENDSFGHGAGGLYVAGTGTTVRISETTVRRNTGATGGALIAASRAEVVRSLFADNVGVAPFGGGGIEVGGNDTRIMNCTLDGNTSIARGGAILVTGNERLIMYNCTVTNNVSNLSGTPGEGAGAINLLDGSLTIGNSIVAGNTDLVSFYPDISGATVDSVGGNLVGIGNLAGGYSETEDLVGTVDAPLDPMLGPLADNGGLTLTRMPLEGSPAINAGMNSLISWSVFGDDPYHDQRGDNYLRIKEGVADCGAVETGAIPGAVHSADLNGDCQISLVELMRVIQLYNSGGLHCADLPGLTEDGYVPGPGAGTDCTPHSSDYYGSQIDWSINIVELLRLIFFYNSAGYYLCLGGGTEDGYCPVTE